jgi:hypothetical protein
MTDHETFVLLAARQISEPLSAEEEADLAAHLALCPPCRSTAAGMRRDEIALQAELGIVTVAPRVRRRVLDEAARGRHLNKRLTLALAAALIVATIGGPFIAGSRFFSGPSPSPEEQSSTVAPVASSSRSQGIAPSSAVPPGVSPIPSGLGPFVVGAYTYSDSPRSGTVTAHFEDGRPVGEWSRRIPATGKGTFYGGPVVCLVVDGTDAWLAGPATTATDDTNDRAVLIYVHDGGPDGIGDAVVFWLTTPGQTLTTVEDWCRKRFLPTDPSPLTKGDIVVRDSP